MDSIALADERDASPLRERPAAFPSEEEENGDQTLGDAAEADNESEAQPVAHRSLASPHTKQEAAHRRLMRRHVELCETEDELLRNMSRLTLCLSAFSSSGVWTRGDERVFNRTHDVLRAASQAHLEVRAGLAASLADAHRLGSVFDAGLAEQMAECHSALEDAASACSSIIREAGSGEENLEALDLLMRPTQRLMQYRLFLQEILADCTILQSSPPSLLAAIEQGLEAVKRICGAVNEKRRQRERVERVGLIAERVVGVPEGVTLIRRDRLFLLDQDTFMQKDCTSYRKLVLFNDAILVLQKGEKAFSFFTSSSTPDAAPHVQPELHFKDLILLKGLAPCTCTCAVSPASSRTGSDSPGSGARERSWSFEIRGRVFFGSEEVVLTWVGAIRDAVAARTTTDMALDLVRQMRVESHRGESHPYALQHLAGNQLSSDKDGARVVLYSF